MKYILDNDLHIHSQISACSNDPEQNNERILQYAKTNGLKIICLTDHFWDDAVEGASNWYKPQNYERIAAAKPLPQGENVKFLFGCETELNKNLILGLSKEKFDLFDFIVIPINHFHMVDFTISKEDASTTKNKAQAWTNRLEGVLGMDLPFHKVGIAHLAGTTIIARERADYLEVLSLISEEDMERLFTKAAKLGVGIELNSDDMSFSDEEADIVLRPFRIAKRCGCKFYFGSDAHSPSDFDNVKKIFERAIDLLDLTENDKFTVGAK